MSQAFRQALYINVPFTHRLFFGFIACRGFMGRAIFVLSSSFFAGIKPEGKFYFCGDK